MFDGEGNRLAGCVGETARHAARERVGTPSQGAARHDGQPSPHLGNATRIVVVSVDRARRTRPYV
jgi:hypothetical protein